MALVESLALPLGSDLIPFSLLGVDGVRYTDQSFRDANVLIVVFTCNHCPYAQAAEPFLLQLAHTYLSRGVAFVAINANDADQYAEDSFEAMQARATEKNYPFPYLWDEDQVVARAYQAQCTPDIYVFDAQRQLAYHGRVNNVRQAGDVAITHELQDAIEALLNNTMPALEQKPSLGCSIKWKSK